jgi:hypothetical protein
MNRIMNALVPASGKRTMTAKMLGKALANKSVAPHTHAEVRWKALTTAILDLLSTGAV